MSRPPAVVVSLLIACAVAPGCSRDGAPGPARDAPTGLVRLLPPPAEGEAGLLFEPTFADGGLDDWFVIELDDATPAPAAGHPLVRIEDGALRLEPGSGVLARLVVLPSDTMWRATVTLTAPAGAAAGAACPSLRLPRLDYLDDVEAARTTAGDADAPAGSLVRLAQLVGDDVAAARRWTKKIVNAELAAGFAWDPLPRLDGLRGASMPFRTEERGELRALCIELPAEPIAIASVAVGPAPSLDRADLSSYEHLPPSQGLDLVVARVSFAADERPAIRVDPDTGVSIETALPPDARAIRFALALPSDLGPDARVLWSLELVGPKGSFDRAWDGAADPPDEILRRITHQHHGERQVVDYLLVGRGDIERGTGPVLWREHELRWPSGIQSGPVVVHLAVSGSGPLFVAQPTIVGPRADRSPNLLFVSVDTVRADRMGLYGGPDTVTPRLDAFAQRAVVVERAMSVGPYTLPTHATMFTGLFPLRHGARNTTDRIDTGRVAMLAQLLAARGFATAGFTGGGFLSPDFGFATGFDRYQSIDPIPTDDVAAGYRYSFENRPHRDVLDELHSLDSVQGWIRRHADQRWFAFVHTYEAHRYAPPPEDFERFDTRPGSDWGLDVHGHLRPRAWLEEPPRPADVEHLRNLYDAALHHADRRIGALLEQLEAEGLLEDTIVVVTSDHGEEFLEHGHLRHSQSLYEEMLHVPLLVRLPGSRGQARVDETFHQVDLMPTLLELLGAPVPPDLDGRSRAELLRGATGRAAAGDAPDLYAAVDTSLSRRAAVRVGPYKIIRGEVSDTVTYPAREAWELYDLRNDPGETTNLFAAQPDLARRLQQALEEIEQGLRARAVDAQSAGVREGVLEQLREMGYVGDG